MKIFLIFVERLCDICQKLKKKLTWIVKISLYEKVQARRLLPRPPFKLGVIIKEKPAVVPCFFLFFKLEHFSDRSLVRNVTMPTQLAEMQKLDILAKILSNSFLCLHNSASIFL